MPYQSDEGMPARRFQSTPSGGKATLHTHWSRTDGIVSIHAFRGEGDGESTNTSYPSTVSIHAFRGEGDEFTPVPWHGKCVSIHAFRGEGDRNVRTS